VTLTPARRHFHLRNKLHASPEENSSLTEEKFMLLTPKSLFFGTFEKRQSNGKIFLSLLRNLRAKDIHPRDVFMSAGITCAALAKSEFCANLALNKTP